MDPTTWTTDSSLSLNLGHRPLCELRAEVPVSVLNQHILFSFVTSTLNFGVMMLQKNVLEAELSRMSGENKRLSEMLSMMHAQCSSLQGQLLDLKSSPPSPEKKRKNESSDGYLQSPSSEDSCRRSSDLVSKTKVSKFYVHSNPSDKSLIVKDGYQWRKYGQKVTRDNPSPRAYFKCSFAPSCPVKKKVQRSAVDKSILVATYEGEHNHGRTLHAETGAGHSLCSFSTKSSGSEITPNLTPRGSNRDLESPEFQRLLVEQMASSLTKDPSFTASLASAISGMILQISPGRNQ
ncbi:hypothetical protein J5N97_003237 [Dioscorea zingiberensis]|uniref:WRKY domain-containing protein n=1 Tax=Dioscorea zingiberensis TaxID=325984 RepID=A0A9D5D4A3_9LILI|nr:hypothetical protein J5N97_003237 [Dioscorea zingiberensis]